MVRFACSQCHSGLRVDDNLAGQAVKCPKCGFSMPVPNAPPPSPLTPPAPVAVVSDSHVGMTPETKFLIGVCGTFAVAVLGFLVWFLVIRDTWESEHASEVLRLSSNVVKLIRAKDQVGAAKEYDALLRLVGTRRIANPDLAKSLSQAANVAEPVRRRIGAEQAVAQARAIESEAHALVESGEPQRATEKFQQALDLIAHTGVDSPESAALATRISEAKALAVAKLGEMRQEEEVERKRIEEDKRLATIKARIKGGAWLTNKAGASEPLRGLTISILRSRGTKEQYLSMVRASIDAATAGLEDGRSRLASVDKWLQEHPEIPLPENPQHAMVLAEEATQDAIQHCREGRGSLDDVSKGYADQRAIREAVSRSNERAANLRLRRTAVVMCESSETWLAESQKLLQLAGKSRRNAGVGIAASFGLGPTPANCNLAADANCWKTWMAICREQELEAIHADVDGKYSVEIPGGQYYLYATFDSSYSEVVWFVPVKVDGPGEFVVDLRNDNAAKITNKGTIKGEE